MNIVSVLLSFFHFQNTRTVKLSVLLLAAFSMHTAVLAQKEGSAEFPVPAGNPKQLFFLQRTENTNTVIYELNEENGSLNAANPIRAFWILYAKNGQKEDLSGMEKEFAYGVNVKSIAEDHWQFTLAAYPKITLKLLKDAAQKYHVYVTPGRQHMILNKIYIQEKTRFLKMKPTVDYIEFTGIDVASGKEVTERVEP